MVRNMAQRRVLHCQLFRPFCKQSITAITAKCVITTASFSMKLRCVLSLTLFRSPLFDNSFELQISAPMMCELALHGCPSDGVSFFHLSPWQGCLTTTNAFLTLHDTPLLRAPFRLNSATTCAVVVLRHIHATGQALGNAARLCTPHRTGARKRQWRHSTMPRQRGEDKGLTPLQTVVVRVKP